MKNRMASGFDFLAPFYDNLARLIIGNDIVNSQLHFLNQFAKCKHLLILGGGSGLILDPLFKEIPNIRIDYIDLSPEMIKLARKRSGNKSPVIFIQGTENNIPDQLYDGVITNFYLDMFHERSLEVVLGKIKSSLADEALWAITDFVEERRGHSIKLWMMYRFFRLVAGIEATFLPDWQKQLTEPDCKLLDSKTTTDGFIKSNLYEFKRQAE